MIKPISQDAIRTLPRQWKVVGQNIMRGLDAEGFFNFSVWCQEQMEEDSGREEEGEEGICCGR